MSRYRSAFYERLVADWQNFGNWTQSGARTATERAVDVWKRRLSEFQAPASAAATADILDQIARRTAEGGGHRQAALPLPEVVCMTKSANASISPSRGSWPVKLLR
ncbi:trimethylamine methyltransferase family protein [Mesorhizobium sp. ASY16-5R]|uniref:trimethylamine methyltransferase family protein n=1 Tax=Mesorhizobium sp. ASY16-5R TaxID=3445772 RepID=UPI003FA15154